MKDNPFQLLNIILLKSEFNRSKIIHFESEKFESKININIKKSENANLLSIFLSVSFVAGVNILKEKEKEIKFDIEMLGTFKFSSIPKETVETFGDISAPAIIFPFIREQLSSLSAKAGIPPILLPPVNFVELAKKKKKTK